MSEKLIRKFSLPRKFIPIGRNRGRYDVYKDGKLYKQSYVHKIRRGKYIDRRGKTHVTKGLGAEGLKDSSKRILDEMSSSHKSRETKKPFAYQCEVDFVYLDTEGEEQPYSIRTEYYQDMDDCVEYMEGLLVDKEDSFDDSDYDINAFLIADIKFNVIYRD